MTTKKETYLDTERERGNVEEENVGNRTGEDTTLDRGTDGDGLVRVDTLGRLAAKDRLDGLDDLGHTRHATNEDDLLDLGGLHAGVGERLLARLYRLLDQGADELLELLTGELEVDVLRARGVGSDVRQVDVGLGGGRQLNLGLLGSLTDTLDRHAVLGKVDRRLLLELADNVVDERNVKVLTTEVGVAVGRLDLEDTLLHLEDRDIERATTQVVDGDLARVVAVEAVSESGGSRLVDDTENVKAGDRTGVLGRLTLRVVEARDARVVVSERDLGFWAAGYSLSGNGDDGVLDRLAEEALGGLLQLADDESTDLGGRVLLAASLEPCVAVRVLDNLERNVVQVLLDLGVGELATDQTLGREEGVLWRAVSIFEESRGWKRLAGLPGGAKEDGVGRTSKLTTA